ncbi:MAG: short chain dehydrogenase [Bacteroidetes bacterium]|nr:MAG: short chain dehydrogenase [Bacteroidota bacterium]PIE88731.1 MAG: short chain dehydrogenase [Bacteroidota bacterium]
MKDKVVIITGASSGIGRALAVQFVKQGSMVVLAARSKEKLLEVEASLQGYPGKVLVVPTDVSVEKECQRLVEKTVAVFGRIDILINNAGISMRALFCDLKLEVLERLMAVNFWGTVYCSKYAEPYLVKQRGSLVGVISIAGYQGLPARTGYSASKYAIRGFLDTVRIENLKTGMHVMIAAPGFTQSNIRFSALTADATPQGATPRKEKSMMSPEYCAYRIYWAIRRRKRSLILTTQGKLTVLLNKLFPRFVDYASYRLMEKEPNSPLQRYRHK